MPKNNTTSTYSSIVEFSDFLYSCMEAIKQVPELTNRINELESTVENLRENNCDEGWVTLTAAAKRCGLTQPALRQRIRAHKYPESIVWKQTNNVGAIFVNIAELRRYL
jgi:hypothetical protein